MDLIVGYVNSSSLGLTLDFHTCVFSGNYNKTIISKRVFTNLMGDEIQILSVFLGRGSCMNEVHKSLQQRDLACNTIGWFRATPGQIVDEVHFFLNPWSMANTWSRSVDQLTDPTQVKGDVAAKPKPPRRESKSDKPDIERIQPDLEETKPDLERIEPTHTPVIDHGRKTRVRQVRVRVQPTRAPKPLHCA